MNVQGYEQLTLFQEDFLASHFPKPGNEKAKEMTVISGRKCSELSESSGQLGLLVKMLLESSIWHSTRCFLTWKAQDTPHRRLLFRLVAWMPRTEGNASAYWPTLLANGMGSTGHQKMLRKLVERKLLTEEEYQMMINGNTGRINPEWAEWLMGYCRTFSQLLPTPVACDAKSSPKKRFIGGGTATESCAKSWKSLRVGLLAD